MNQPVSVYQRGSEQGVGLKTAWGGIDVHVIAWNSGEVERRPAHAGGMDGIIVLPLCTLFEALRAGQRGNTDAIIPPAEVVVQPSNDENTSDELTPDELAQKAFDAWTVPEDATEARIIEAFLLDFGSATTNKDVIAALASKGISVTSPQVTVAKKKIAEESQSQPPQSEDVKAGE